MGARSTMLGIMLLPALNFCIMARGSAILNAVADINVGVNVLVNIMR